MLKLVLSIFISSITLTATADFGSWGGYKPVSSLTTKEAPQKLIDFATNSVVKVHVYSGRNNTFEIVDVDPNGTPASDDAIRNSFRINAIETCRIQRLRKCPVYAANNDISHGGTMFLNNGSFKTCRHTFNGWLKKAVEVNPGVSIEDLIPPMAVRTSSNRVLLSAFLRLDEQFRITKIYPDPTLRFDTYTNLLYYTHDYLELQTTFQPLLDALKDYKLMENRRVTDISAATKVIVFGYPGHYPSAQPDKPPGRTLVASVGTVMLSMDERVRDYVLLTDATTDSGSSGAPVLDVNGTLLGMSCGRTEESTDFISVHPDTIDESWAR